MKPAPIALCERRLGKRGPDVQKQAALLAERDAAIAQLQQQLSAARAAPTGPATIDAASAPVDSPSVADLAPRDPKAAAAGSGGADAVADAASGSLRRLQKEGDGEQEGAWEALPVPETLREALEQILLLQARLLAGVAVPFHSLLLRAGVMVLDALELALLLRARLCIVERRVCLCKRCDAASCPPICNLHGLDSAAPQQQTLAIELQASNSRLRDAIEGVLHSASEAPSSPLAGTGSAAYAGAAAPKSAAKPPSGLSRKVLQLSSCACNAAKCTFGRVWCNAVNYIHPVAAGAFAWSVPLFTAAVQRAWCIEQLTWPSTGRCSDATG